MSPILLIVPAVLLLASCAEREMPSAPPTPASPAAPEPAPEPAVRSYDPARFDTDRPETWPHTIAEAVAVILLDLKEESRARLKAMPRDAVSDYHHGWGTSIRNRLGLWRGNEELLLSCKAGEPDDASMVIMEAVWDALHAEGDAR
jgi:hypothetical protein